MIRKHTLYLGLVGAALSGCGSHYMYPGYSDLITLGDFRSYVEHTRKYAPCKWESRGQVGTRVQYDYGCHGGPWNTSTLLVNQTQQEVDQVRVLWRERPDSPTIKDDIRIANEFLLSALLYAMPEAAESIQQTFFKRTNKQIKYGPLNVVLTTEKQDRGEWLHRMVITDTRPIGQRPAYAGFHGVKQRPVYHYPGHYRQLVKSVPQKQMELTHYTHLNEKHDPYATDIPGPALQPTTPAAAPDTAEAINKIRRPVQPVEITESRDLARGVETHTESVAEQIMQVREGAHHGQALERQPIGKPVMVEQPIQRETVVRTEDVQIAPVVPQHPVRENTPIETGSREDRLRNILLQAAGSTEKATEAEKTKKPVNYIYDEEAYLKDIEDEVYRQMKGQYEDSKSTGNGWDDLKGIREGLEIMEFNMSDEGGL